METLSKKEIAEMKKMITDAYDYTFYAVVSGEMSKEQGKDFKHLFKMAKSEEIQTLIGKNKRLLALQDIFDAGYDTEKTYSFEVMLKLAKETEEKLNKKQEKK